jgi:hypothetical protein
MFDREKKRKGINDGDQLSQIFYAHLLGGFKKKKKKKKIAQNS